MLEIKDLVKKYPGGRTAVSHFSLNIREGEIIAVLGGKGAGKTSLLKTLAGAEEKTSGKVLLNGKPLVLNDVIMVFDDLALINNRTLKYNLERSLRLRGMASAEMSERILAATDYLGLTPRLLDKTKSLTLVEKKKAALARLTIREDYNVVLVDDITAGLPEKGSEEVWELAMTVLLNLGKTVIYATENPREAVSISDKVVILENGGIKQAGHFSEIAENPACLASARALDRRYNTLPAKLIKVEGLALEIGKNKLRLDVSHLEPALASEEFIGKEVLVGFSAADTVQFEGGIQLDVIYVERTAEGSYLKCLHPSGPITLFEKSFGIFPRTFAFLPRADKVLLFDAVTENSILNFRI